MKRQHSRTSPTTQRRHRFPILYKMVLTLSLLLGLTLGLLWLQLDNKLNELLYRQSDAFGATIARQLADVAREPLLADDRLALEVLLNSLASDPTIVGAAIYDAERQPLIQLGDPYLDANIMHTTQTGAYVIPIVFQDVVAGYVQVALNQEPITRTVRETQRILSGITGLMLLLALVASVLLARHLLRPVQRLSEATRAIREGNYEHRIDSRRHDELGELVVAFNEMARGLAEREQLKQTFSRFIPGQVAHTILAAPDQPELPDEYVYASVLFIDIVGFTTLCERLDPQTVAKLLNTYYRCIEDACGCYQGTIDKFIGDGAMILFGVPEPDPDHALKGVHAALLFLQLVDQLNQQRRRQGLDIAEFRLGLHSGDMLAGMLSARDRLQYTVVGDSVNVASRLCAEASPGSLIISEQVLKHPGLKGRLRWRQERQLMLRGKQTPLTAYEVHSLSNAEQQDLQRNLHQLLNKRMLTS